MTETEPPTSSRHLRLELRRGALVLAVLGQLRREHYGYTLRKALAERGLPVDEGTLYPLLRRLESHGPARERMARGRQAAKALLSPLAQGSTIVALLEAEWRGINTSLTRILEDD